MADQSLGAPPHSPRDGNPGLELLAALVIGLLVALGTGQPWKTFGFAATLLAAAVGAFLLEFWARQYWLTPIALPEVIVDDQALLTSSITSSRRSAYAISSNWLALWRTSTFRYYLHLDAAMSLAAYSSGLVSPLDRLSRAHSDQKEFFEYGKALLRSIGEGKIPLRRHRIRLLIYPQVVYDNFANEITHLIRSHSAARIPCIPLVEEQLYKKLDAAEREEMGRLVGAL